LVKENDVYLKGVLLQKIMELKEKTYIALFWSFIERSGDQLFRFVFSIVLARLLLPEHFGLIGLAFIVTEIARIFVQSGFGLALINKNNHTMLDECSVFYFNVFVGLLASIGIFVLAPFIGMFYKSAELVPIVRVMSATVFISSFGTIQTTLLTKSIDFKSQTLISLPSTLASGVVGIVLAYHNYGVWALVVQSIMSSVLQTILLWLIYGWRPSLQFSFFSLKEMFPYGSRLLASSLVQMLFGNIYTILIGKLFNQKMLGYYTRSVQMQKMPLDSIWGIFWRVTFPVLSSVKTDVDQFNRILKKAANNISFVVFPLLLISFVISEELFTVLFGIKWAASVPMFKILCFAGLFVSLEQMWEIAIISKGFAGLRVKLQMIKYAIILISIVITYRFGLIWMLLGYCLVMYLNYLITALFLSRVTRYKLSNQLADVYPYLLSAIGGAFISYVIMVFVKQNYIVSIVVASLAGGLSYAALCYWFKLSAMVENYQMVLRKINKTK